MVARSWGQGAGELLFKRYRVSVLQMKNRFWKSVAQQCDMLTPTELYC